MHRDETEKAAVTYNIGKRANQQHVLFSDDSSIIHL